MNRREILKLLGLGIVGHELDIDKLLWVPGQKKIFLPSKPITEAQIVAEELNRFIFKMKGLFDRDDVFYKMITEKESEPINSRKMRVPLIIKPGEWK
jgi:hypothetical protein